MEDRRRQKKYPSGTLVPGWILCIIGFYFVPLCLCLYTFVPCRYAFAVNFVPLRLCAFVPKPLNLCAFVPIF